MKIWMCALMLALSTGASAQNPIISGQYSADPTARVFNGKMYLYPSHDIPSPIEKLKEWFCMADYHVFSSSNLTEWLDHGVIVSQDKVPWVQDGSYTMWAPDCVEISLSVLIYQHTRIYAVHTLYGFPHRHKRSFGLVGNSHTYSESLLLPFRSGREIKVILPVFLHTIRSPHRITAILYPRHFVLRNDDTIVFPIRQIAG